MFQLDRDRSRRSSRSCVVRSSWSYDRHLLEVLPWLNFTPDTQQVQAERFSYSRVVHSSLMSSTTIDALRHKHGCLLQPSRSGISLLFPSFFSFLYMFAAEMQHYPTVLQRKISIQCLEHTVSRTPRACGEPDNLFFFMAQFIFFYLAA